MDKLTEKLCMSCPSYKEDYCGHISAGTQNECSLLATLKQGYEIGRKETAEKAIKWYCLDCSCNVNCCTDHKCFFHQMFTEYLNGNDRALPPKDDGHIFKRFRKDFMQSASSWLFKNAGKYDTQKNSEITRLSEDLEGAMKDIYLTP